MPLWLWLASFGLLLLASMLVQSLAIWVAALVVRARIAPQRALAAALLIAAVGMIAAASGLFEESLRGLAVTILALVLAVAIVRGAIRRGWGRSIVTFLIMIAVQLPLALALRTVMVGTVAEAFSASSSAMAPTLRLGDRFAIDPKLAPRRWDLVVFAPPNDPSTRFVFRIAGMPGDSIEIVGGRIRIDGRDVEVPPELAGNDYTPPHSGGHPTNTAEGRPLTLGAGQYFVIGDDPRVANDSRMWHEPAGPGVPTGAVPRQSIRGVVRMIYWPASRLRLFR